VPVVVHSVCLLGGSLTRDHLPTSCRELIQERRVYLQLFGQDVQAEEMAVDAKSNHCSFVVDRVTIHCYSEQMLPEFFLQQE